jgi:hypothetical protein
MSSSAPADFRFGIEIEVLCKSLEEPKQKWDPAAEELSDALKAAGLENEVLLISPQVDKYEIWKVKREPQIYDEEKEPTRRTAHTFGTKVRMLIISSGYGVKLPDLQVSRNPCLGASASYNLESSFYGVRHHYE